MKVAVIYSSRGRPLTFEKTLNQDFSDVTLYLGIEEDELHLYKPHLPKHFHVLKVFKGLKITKEEMWGPGFAFPAEADMHHYLTANTKGRVLAEMAIADGHEWIICLVDNLFFPLNYFPLLLPFFTAYQKTETILAYQNDAARKLVCYSIFTPEWFLWNNREIQYQGYYHSFGDAEVYLSSLLSNKLVPLPAYLNPYRKHAFFGTAEIDDMFWLANDKFSQAQAEPIFIRRRDEILKAHSLKVF